MPPPLLPQTRGGKRERDDGCTCPSTGTIIALGVCRSNAFAVEYQRRFTHENHETALCQGKHGRQYFSFLCPEQRVVTPRNASGAGCSSHNSDIERHVS